MKKTFTQKEIPTLAREILALLKPGTSATVVALSGELGAGKTTLSQAIARELGITENVISPTFVIMKSYGISNKPKKLKANKLIHIDAYRLNSHQELSKLGWTELVADPKNLILIEWPERVAKLIPHNAYEVSLSHLGENDREISLTKKP